MEIKILAIGKVKESYIKQGMEEFINRLTPYTEVEIIEVKGEQVKGNLSSAEMEQVKKKEMDKLLKRADDRAYTIALDSDGKPMTSEGLAKSISNLQVQGYSSIEFIIGGPLGLHEKIKEEVDYVLTFSHLTFTHQMIRLILLEQVYRAFKIMNNEPYHL
jgi:23S rRNA (pseudouridine1915-N3)-methyltransferase